MNTEDGVFQSFLIEMGESIDELETDLGELESGFDLEIINRIFRSVHTKKGTGGFFGLAKLQELTHHFEDVLMQIRDETIDYKDKMITVFFNAVDLLKNIHESEDYGESLEIQDVCKDFKNISLNSDEPEISQIESFDNESDNSINEIKVNINEVNNSQVEQVKVEIEKKTTIEAGGSKDSGKQIQSVANSDFSVTNNDILPPKKDSQKPKNILQKDKPLSVKVEKNKADTVRVKVDLLDKLMELTGEIVLGRNQLLQQLNDTSEKNTILSVAHMISDLQQLVLQTRMQPIGSVFTKFKRIVRDLERTLSKSIGLIIEGEDTELDRSIIEALSDPLTHLLRNCADHGIEAAEERLKKRKTAEGKILLKAQQEGGQVKITVKDDGRGIDPEKIKTKALSNSLISQKKFESMSDAEAVRLIFHPGLSTAEEVTTLSGRGVGMDVVKSTFEKIGGVIDIDSKVDSGTTILVHLPTTMAIMSSLIVRIDGDRFAIPHSELKEVILVRPDDEQQIELMRGKMVYRLRGSLIPILDLKEITELEIEQKDDITLDVVFEELTVDAAEQLFVVLHSGVNKFGLKIDSIDHTEEIVVKPLAQILRTLSYYAGSSILGDSDVAMVLSANGICQNRSLHFDNFDSQSEANNLSETTRISDLQENQDLLVFKANDIEQLAIPLSLVFKVEQINLKDVQQMSDKYFIQLEGKNVLLLYLHEYLDLKPFKSNSQNFYVILPKIDDFNGGIVAAEINEPVHMKLNLNSHPIDDMAILGVTTIRNKVTYLIDVFSLAEQISPGRHKRMIGSANVEQNRLLIVEDTPFFRYLERNYFESVGFNVSEAKNGKEALQMLLERPTYFNLVISDIVMPVMDGYEMVRQIKSNKKLSNLPIIALTSFSEEEYKEKALESGFDDFAVKTNKESILAAVRNFLGDK